MNRHFTTACFVAALLILLIASPALAGGTIRGKIEYKTVRFAKDTVVWVNGVKGEFEPEDAAMDQRGSTFNPKVLPVLMGSAVTFSNNDPTNHNVYSPDHEKYDLGTKGKGETLVHTFDSKGVYTQLCKLHPTMIAYVVVLDNPFFAVSDKTGAFVIENVPAGKHTLKIWNERFKGDSVEVDVREGAETEIAIALHR